LGDGVNDAAALAQSDLGIALGTGSDAAKHASDLTLISGDLQAAADAIRLSRADAANDSRQPWWAFAYNVVALPLAAMGFLNPMIAAAAMAFSSLFVVTNSLRPAAVSLGLAARGLLYGVAQHCEVRAVRGGFEKLAAAVSRSSWQQRRAGAEED
jgi:magnesium-transporting ATPase (P-type)